MLAWLSRQLVLGDGKGSTLRDCPVRGPLAHVCATVRSFDRVCQNIAAFLYRYMGGLPSSFDKLGQSDTATHSSRVCGAATTYMHAWARALNIDQYIGRLRPKY